MRAFCTFAFCLAVLRVGTSMLARIAMMAMTTSSSIKVKAASRQRFFRTGKTVCFIIQRELSRLLKRERKVVNEMEARKLALSRRYDKARLDRELRWLERRLFNSSALAGKTG